jgi:hypothetical protein
MWQFAKCVQIVGQGIKIIDGFNKKKATGLGAAFFSIFRFPISDCPTEKCRISDIG